MNTLKRIRLELGISQIEAANILNISRRSFQMYENMKSGFNDKYQIFVEKLSKHIVLDEEHGVLTIEEIKKKTKPIFDKYDVISCFLFGSYAKRKAKEDSDVDLLIDTKTTGLKYFGLIEEIRQALNKKVDLLDLKQVTNNELLLSEILKDGIKIYG